VARSLFAYVKIAHLNTVTGLHEFAKLLVSDAAIGSSGFLIIKGLLPLTPEDRRTMQKRAKQTTAL
jgi:phosphate transport system substrate-binding protein